MATHKFETITSLLTNAHTTKKQIAVVVADNNDNNADDDVKPEQVIQQQSAQSKQQQFNSRQQQNQRVYQSLTGQQQTTMHNMQKSLTTIHINVPKHFQGILIGKEARNLKRMEAAYDVKILVPSKSEQSEKVRIHGMEVEKLHQCRNEIAAFVIRLQNPGGASIPVQRRFLPIIIGKGGENIKMLRAHFPYVIFEVTPVDEIETDEAGRRHVKDSSMAIIMLRGYMAEVDAFSTVLNTLITELELRRHQDVFPLPANDKAAVKFLQRTKYRLLNEQYPDVRVIFFAPNNVVKLEGPKQKVEAVKQILHTEMEKFNERKQRVKTPKMQKRTVENVPITKGKKQLNGRKQMVKTQKIQKCTVETVPIATKKFVKKFLESNGQLLAEIKNKHSKCSIQLDKKRQLYVIQGGSVHVKEAKRAIEDILAQMKRMVQYVPIVETKFLWKFFTSNVQLLKEIQRKHLNCSIRFEKRKKKRYFVVVSKSVEDTEKAKWAIEEMLAQMGKIETRQLQIPSQHHKQLRMCVSEFQQKFNVMVMFPPVACDFVQLIGPEKVLDEAAQELHDKCPKNYSVTYYK